MFHRQRYLETLGEIQFNNNKEKEEEKEKIFFGCRTSHVPSQTNECYALLSNVLKTMLRMFILSYNFLLLG